MEAIENSQGAHADQGAYAEAAASSETGRKHTSVDDGQAVGFALGFSRDSWGNDTSVISRRGTDTSKDSPPWGYSWGIATPVMGIILQPVPAALAAQLPMLGEDRGWLVGEILPESPLCGGDGLKLYDVIMAVDCEPIDTIRQFRRVLAMSLGLDPIPVEIIRGGKAKTIQFYFVAAQEETPRQTGHPAARQQSVSVSRADGEHSLALASVDGVNYQLEVSFRRADGKNATQRLAGTVDKILQEAESLPSPVYKLIRDTLAPERDAIEGTEFSGPRAAWVP